jgi:RNA-splicing ligase RtcB
MMPDKRFLPRPAPARVAVMEKIGKQLISWASILEESTRNQAVTASGMPFIYPHLALMPDAHLGKGATVGSVIPTLGAITPPRWASTSDAV